MYAIITPMHAKSIDSTVFSESPVASAMVEMPEPQAWYIVYPTPPAAPALIHEESLVPWIHAEKRVPREPIFSKRILGALAALDP